MYGNSQYEKNSLNFYFIHYLGGIFFFFFCIYGLIVPSRSNNVLI